MVTIALTGGLGAGKSSVARMFAECGAGLVSLDEIGHGVLTMPEVKRELERAFGAGIFDEAGDVVRPRLAAAAFDSAEHTALLNGITHPAITQECLRRIDVLGATHEAVVVEVTSGDMTHAGLGWADVLVAVAVPQEVRLERACARGGIDKADMRQRMAAQSSEEVIEAAADYLVDNAGAPEDARAQVEALWARLVGEGAGAAASDGACAASAPGEE